MTYPKEHKLKMQAGGAHGGERRPMAAQRSAQQVWCAGEGDRWPWGGTWVGTWDRCKQPYPATLLLKVGGGAASVAAVIHAHTMN